jgi:hypothetical protein
LRVLKQRNKSTLRAVGVLRFSKFEFEFKLARAKTQSAPGRSCKSQIRNPKFETISNDQKIQSSKPARFGFCTWDLGR